MQMPQSHPPSCSLFMSGELVNHWKIGVGKVGDSGCTERKEVENIGVATVKTTPMSPPLVDRRHLGT